MERGSLKGGNLKGKATGESRPLSRGLELGRVVAGWGAALLISVGKFTGGGLQTGCPLENNIFLGLLRTEGGKTGESHW